MYLYETMSNPLPQITFDFSSDDYRDEQGKEVKAVAAAQPTETTVLTESSNVSGRELLKEQARQKKSTRGRLSLKEVGIRADLIEIPPDEILFQKQYYSIGEVAGWFKVNQSLLRYWETEFDILEPRKNRKGDRFFRPVDVKNLVLIHDLLRRRKFTIEGAKDFLKKNKKADEKFAMIQSLEKLKTFLNELKASL